MTEVASLTAMLSLDDSNFNSGLSNVEKRLTSLTSTFDTIGANIKNLGGNMQNVGRSMMDATAPLLGFGATGLQAFGSFENVINEISARTGIVGDDLQDIADYALEMGAASVFSGQQASEAFLDLLTSGQSASEAFETLPHVMNLAAAGGLEFGQSADILTDAMSMFGLSADDMVGNLTAAEYVANSLTQASQVSSATVGMLGEAFVNVGGIASGFGLSVDQTNSALAILAERGIKGAEAGTNLKSMLLGMSATTDSTQQAWAKLGSSLYDSEGNVRNLDTVLDEIRVSMETLPVQEQNQLMQDLAGSYGQASLRALLFGGDLNETLGAMEQSASASEVAQKMMQSWDNTVESLMGSIESFSIEVLWPFVDSTLKPLVNQLINVVNSAIAWTKENPALTQTILKLVAAAVAIGPILLGAGTAVSFIGTAIAGLGTIIGFVLSPIGLLVAAVGALAVAFMTDFGGIRTWFNSNIVPWFEGLSAMFKTGGLKNVGIYINQTVIEPIKSAFASLVSGGQVAQQLKSFGSNIVDNLSSGLKNIGSWFEKNLIKPLANSVGKMVKGAGGAGAIFKKMQGFGFSLLENGFNIAKGILKFVWNRLFKPLGDAIGNYVSSGQLQSHLETLGSTFMDAIGKGLDLLGQGLTWVYDNLIKPLGDAIGNYVTGGQLMDDLNALGGMFMDAISAGINLIGQGLTWVYDNLIKPLGDAIFKYIDSGQLADTLVNLGTGFLDLIGKGITFVQSIPTWIYDTLIKPLFTSVDGESGSGGGLWESLMGFGQSILDGIGQGLNMLGGVASWIWEKVVNPFITGIAEYIGIGEIWEKLKSLGGSILDGIEAGLTYIQSIATWLFNTLISPLIGGFTLEGGTGSDLWNSLLDFGKIFLDVVAQGIGTIVAIGVWVRDTFVGPIIDKIGEFIGVGDLYDKLVELGSGILQWIADGLGDVSAWIYDTVIKPMGDAINDILVSLGFLPDPRFIGYYDAPTGGGVSNRALGGFVSENRPYMVGERGPELFVPSSNGSIVPNEQMGNRIEIQNITINAPSGNGREIAESFEFELSEIMRSRG